MFIRVFSAAWIVLNIHVCDIVRSRFSSPGPTDKDRGRHNGFTADVGRIGFTETHRKALIKGMDIDLVISFLPKSSKWLFTSLGLTQRVCKKLCKGPTKSPKSLRELDVINKVNVWGWRNTSAVYQPEPCMSTFEGWELHKLVENESRMEFSCSDRLARQESFSSGSTRLNRSPGRSHSPHNHQESPFHSSRLLRWNRRVFVTRRR